MSSLQPISYDDIVIGSETRVGYLLTTVKNPIMISLYIIKMRSLDVGHLLGLKQFNRDEA